ncbi:MAG: agmatinase [Candidatus Omnitrophica bacterium]|nr:agmatinase [Candidatus Omnitrophota bacterium]
MQAKNYFTDSESKYCVYKNAKAVIIPVPYEKTTTYIKGTKNAPRAIIDASKKLELYDEELDAVTANIGIATLNPLKACQIAQVMLNEVKARCLSVLNDGKFPVLIGGEHSVSLGFLLALKEKYPDVSVLHLDAHADMRDEYKGSRHNHGCIMARIREHSSAVSVGIRSLSVEEAKIIKKNNYKIFWAKDKTDIGIWAKDILAALGKNVYITLDADVLDPSVLPSVGTPEPDGLSWNEVLKIVKAVFKKKNVVGFDVMELCPSPFNKGSDFITAKLIYKMLGYKFFITSGGI